ncbi:MAG: integrase arm-type DNA-binding domain-containing protein, partial [Hyphomicrobiaceae bacterium]
MAKKLTDIVLKDAKAYRGHRYDILDASGLSVRIGAKAKNFFWRYRKDGKQRRMVLGTYPATSLAEARQRLAEARAQLAEGKDPALTQRETKRAYNDAETVADLTHAYLQRWAKAKKKASSVAEDERLIRTMVLPAIGDMKVVDVTRRTLADLIAKEYARIVANGGKGVSANRLRSLLSKMFMCALK